MSIVAVDLHLMCAQDRVIATGRKDAFDWFKSIVVGALALGVARESLLSRMLVFKWIGPQQVTEESAHGRFLDPINIIDVFLRSHIR